MQQPHKPTQMHLWIYELNMLPHPCSGCYNILVYELGWCLTNSLTIFPNIQLSKVAVYHFNLFWASSLIEAVALPQDKRNQKTIWIKYGTNSNESTILCWCWIYYLAWKEEILISDRYSSVSPKFVEYFYHLFEMLLLRHSEQASDLVLLSRYFETLSSWIQSALVLSTALLLIPLVYKFEQISEDHPYRKICWHIQQLLYQTCCYDLMLFFWLHNLHRKVNLFCSNDVHQHLICIRFLIPVNVFWLKKSQVIIWIHLYLVIHCFSVCWKGDSVVMNPQ